MFRTSLFGAACMLASVSTAFAHITLQDQQAPVGASYRAVFRVPHGCNGSATVAIRVRIPDGFIDVKPMPKPGWKLDVTRAQYQKPISAHGTKVSEGVSEVDWSAGNLPDAYYDEFVLIGYIGDEAPSGQTIYFPVVQECEKGVNRWIEIPAAAGHDHAHDHGHDDAGEPAAGLRLLPKR
jgi:uncharacterized protein YcnI